MRRPSGCAGFSTSSAATPPPCAATGRPYPRRVLLLRATQPLPEPVRDAAARQRGDSPELGWERVAVVSRCDIPAHHLSIVHEPAAALVGARIRDALHAADRIEAIGERVFFTLLGH